MKTLAPSRENILTQSLWHNDNILVNGKTVYYKIWNIMGVRFVNDLLSQDGRFLTFEEFIQTCNVKTNFLHFRGIICTIRTKWRELFRNDVYPVESPFQLPISYFLCSFSHGCKPIYNYLVSFYNFDFKPRKKWQEELGDAYTNLDWSQFNKNPFICTENVNLRWLQFRINNSIIGTNSFLFKINIKPDNKCSFCKVDVETIEHPFYSCPITQQFWLEFASFVNQNTNAFFESTMSIIIFGCRDKMLSFLLLIAKYFIYKCKYVDKNISFKAFRFVLKSYFDTEEYVAAINGNMNHFNVLWELWLPLLQR